MNNNLLKKRCVPLLFAPVLLTSLSTPHSALAFPEEPEQIQIDASDVDQWHASMTLSVNETAQWFDSFFEDERYISEEASSRISLRPSIFFEEGEAAKIKFSVNARFSVPNFNRKLKLVVSEGESVADEVQIAQRTNSRNNAEANETNIALQLTLKEKDRLNTRVAAGVKVGGNHGIDIFVGPRIRKTWRWKPWQARVTERIRWYTDIGWESKTLLDFERPLGPKWLFRGTIDARLRKEDYKGKGLRYDFGPIFIQKLRDRTAISYQWNTNVVTRPNHRIEETALHIRFRKNIWRKWLFFEINPQLAFGNDDDFHPTPGVELRLEASFGGLERNIGIF